jgi:hypothetical protein
MHAARDLALHQGDKRRLIDGAVAKWRDQRWKNAVESGLAHGGPQNAVNIGDQGCSR